MIHHPPIRGATANYKRMIGIRRFHAAIHMDGAELVLHGHTHLNTTYWIEEQPGRVPVVGIASGSQSFGGRKPPAAYNLFQIAGQRGGWTLRKERFGLTGRWRDLREGRRGSAAGLTSPAQAGARNRIVHGFNPAFAGISAAPVLHRRR